MQRNTLFLAYFFICVNCFSQQHPFVHYTPKDGLVNSRVKKAYQDAKGRLYFLTAGGLSIYDGARFTNHTAFNGLPVDIVNDVLEVGDDSILIAVNTGTLNALVKGKMVLIKTEGHPCPTINQFYFFNKNKIFLACDEGLFVLENKKITKLNFSLQVKNNSLAPYLGSITGIGNYLVMATHELRERKGLYLFDIKNNRLCDALTETAFYLLGKDRNDKIWISSSDKLFIIDSSSLFKGKLSYAVPVAGYRQTKNYSSTSVAFGQNCIWFLCMNGNLKNAEIRRVEENGSLSRILLPEQIASTNTKNIFIDKENTIWLCNDGEGIFKIVNSSFRIFQNLPGEKSQIYLVDVFSSGNTSWYSTNTNKIFKRTGKGLEQFNSNLQGLSIFYVSEKKMLAHDIKKIYEGHYHGKNLIKFKEIISLPDTDFFTKKMVVDCNGFIITSQKSGLTIWAKNTAACHIPIPENDHCEELMFDRNNFLWLIKRYNGIDVFTLHPENIFKYLQIVFHFPQDQLTGSPRCFVMDKKGEIWIGTRNDGIIGYRQEGKRLLKLHHFHTGNGLTDNFVSTIATDSLNNIIVGTQTGLDRLVLNPSLDYRIENLSKGSNFFSFITQTWTDNEQAYALSMNGRLLQVSSAPTQPTNYTPRLLLEEMKVNTQTIQQKNDFHYKENTINFLVAAPTFIDEKQVAFSYILKGSKNNRWSDTTNENATINLSNLSPGRYVLKVKAFFPSTPYSPIELTYPFQIAPPWWQTLWFRAVVILLIIGFIILALRFYFQKKLQKKMAGLERQKTIEKERTRIATDMHDDLGAGLSRIKFLSQSILNKKINDEVIRSELQKITSFSDEMSEKMGEIVWALNEKNDTLADLIGFTRSYAVEYLQNHNIECEAKTPKNLSGTFLTGEMRRNIFLSVKECLHNIVKHAEATKVFFSIEVNGKMEIIIHDNGKGIDWNNRRSFSNGLDNIEKRMKEISGKLSFENCNGTKVSMSIPLIL